MSFFNITIKYCVVLNFQFQASGHYFHFHKQSVMCQLLVSWWEHLEHSYLCDVSLSYLLCYVGFETNNMSFGDFHENESYVICSWLATKHCEDFVQQTPRKNKYFVCKYGFTFFFFFLLTARGPTQTFSIWQRHFLYHIIFSYYHHTTDDIIYTRKKTKPGINLFVTLFVAKF